MKYTFWGAGFIFLGMAGVVFIAMFQNLTLNDESEYYTLREAVEASMYEAVDVGYYHDTGEVKIIKEKFVANCTRRFLSSINGSGEGYQLTYYDIIEKPPKVSVVANSRTGAYTIVNEADGFNVLNGLTGILEFDDPMGIGHYITSDNCKNEKIINIPNRKYGKLCNPADRTNENFAGWYTEKDCGGSPVNENTVMGYNVNQDLYDCWSKKQYTITFHANTGDDKGSTLTQVCNFGEKCTLRGVGHYEKTGYRFGGWSERSNGSVISEPVTYNTNKDLYAIWTKIPYTITYDGNGGNSNLSSTTCYYNDKVTLPTSGPTKTGNTFKGWKTEDGTTVTAITCKGNITLLAQWSKSSYTINFDGNGGTSSVSSKSCNYGDTVQLSSYTASRTGYKFDGWKSGGSKVTSVTCNGNKTLTASWTESPKYTLTLSRGDNVSAVSGGGDYTVNSNVTISATVPDYYHFVGWYNGSTLISSSNSCTVKVTANTTLTAKAAPNKIKIYYCWQKSIFAEVRVGAVNGRNSDYTEITNRFERTVNNQHWCDNSVKIWTFGDYSNYLIRNYNGNGSSYRFRKNSTTSRVSSARSWKVGDSDPNKKYISVDDNNVTDYNTFKAAFLDNLTTTQNNNFKTQAESSLYLYSLCTSGNGCQ